MTSESLVRRIKPDFDWSTLRFPGEKTVRTEVEREPLLLEMATEYGNPRLTLPTGFLRGGLAVTPAVTPAIFRVVELVRQVLQVNASIEVEIVPHTERMVELTPDSDATQMTLRVSAPLLADATLRESLFWLGRKIGQALLGQMRLYRDPAAGRGDARRETLLLRGLWRFQELSCDRCGMICCQDLDVAIRSLVRQTSGLPMSLLAISREDWLRDRPYEDESMISPRENDFLMLRVASLEKFVESEKYHSSFVDQVIDAGPFEIRGDEGAEVTLPDAYESESEESVDNAVSEISKLLEPALTSSEVPKAAPTPFVLPTVEKPKQEAAPAASSKEPVLPLPVAQPVVEYRMVGNDPSVVEQVYTYEPSIATLPPTLRTATESIIASGEADANLRRAFTVHAAFWLLSLQESVSKLQQSLLVDLFGHQVYSEVKPGYDKYGDEVFARFCQEASARIRRLDLGSRQDMLRELTRIMMTDNGDLARSEPTLHEIAEMLDLDRDDITMALSEFVDPEYADYTFRAGELVDVHLDGEWVAGVVENVESISGEVRVRFNASGKSLRLHPLADLIRPRPVKQAS
ncbi:hypothetical protein K2Y11_07180 [bacterium]|nr:hypothetical protein [bacterium]